MRYTTSDGKEFRTKEAADIHELGLQLKPQLDAYFNTLKLRAETPKGLILSRARLRKNILNFLAWQQAQAEAKSE
jgi:hypothetical protein